MSDIVDDMIGHSLDEDFDPHTRKTFAEGAATIAQLRAEAALAKVREAEPDYWYRNYDPDESGDSPYNALTDVPDLCVCLLHSSYVGPSKYAFRAQTLSMNDDDDEVLLFDTEDEALAAANQRAQDLKALADFHSLTGGE